MELHVQKCQNFSDQWFKMPSMNSLNPKEGQLDNGSAKSQNNKHHISWILSTAETTKKVVPVTKN